MESAKNFIERKNTEFTKFKADKKIILMKDIGRQGKHGFVREGWAFLPASNLKDHKVFVFERLSKVSRSGRFAYNNSNPLGEREYRIGYYIVGRIGRARGRWIWGQFCPIIPIKDLNRLLRIAKKEGVIL